MSTETSPASHAAEAPSAAQPNPPPAICLDGVAKTYESRHGDVTAVHDLDLEIAEGEFFSLLGPSGCGKTTTMRMVAGFERPSRGTVRLHGEDVTAVPPHRRDVNMVFQSYALFPHMSVYDNIAFGLRRRRVPASEVTGRVEAMLELVQLTGERKRRPGQLSGGQQQRVALARALVNRPRALLLDEPLGALDLKLRQSMQTELKRIQREVGITFVYVTHDQGEALTMSDRIAVMNAGVIEQLGAPAEVYERPASRFVAGFIGTSNLLSAPVDRVEGTLAVLRPGERQRILVHAAQARTGEQLDLTVRPEKVRLSIDEPTEPSEHELDCRLRGEVTDVTYLGSATHYTVRTSLGCDVAVYVQNAHDATNVACRGEQVWLAWRSEHSYPLSGTRS
ncbi:ABC transporter ATP-binding protein [Pseudonocardia acaciae]|uniref:ABC transporter ATP-binding protein n=1 Tax=Pseudonocardia acaciae TaxID=551276 RepID=UPI00048A9C04|nr:ABC transporter ATP-binding protein [Pseudonocardia acaciae]